MSSLERYADPSQTLIFLDWDDTLFPTTEVFKRWKLSLSGQGPADAQKSLAPSLRHRPSKSMLASIASAATAKARAILRSTMTLGTKVTPADGPEGGVGTIDLEMKGLLSTWSKSLEDYLNVACSLSDRVVIITNARGTWVEECLDTFAPELRRFFASGTAGGEGAGPGKAKIVYARDFLDDIRKKGRFVGARGAAGKAAQMTQAKFHAMKHEAKAFYRSYPGQTWKNIISIGDMPYEHEAVQELGLSRRSPPRECLRIKSLLLPDCPTITELTLRLKFSKCMLPVYVDFDGDLELNLRDATDPLEELSKALSMPHLLETEFPRHAWGRSSAPADEQITEALSAVEAALVHKNLVGDELGSTGRLSEDGSERW